MAILAAVVVGGAIIGIVAATKGPNSPASAPHTSNTTGTVSATSTPSTPNAPHDESAAVFEGAGLPVTSMYTFTAANDPNKLLGRPKGYIAKVAWTDGRIDASTCGCDTAQGSVALGGSVEQFTDPLGALARESYIQSVEKSMPILGTEYDYAVGDDLIRVSAQLTPAQAGAYQAAAES